MEGDETLTLTEEKVSHPSTLEPARLTSKCLPFPVLEKSRKSYTLPKKGMSKTSHKSGMIPELPLTLSGTDCFRKILTRESVNFCWESVDLGEVLDATVRPLCGWRGLEPSSSIAPGSWPREAAVMLKRSGATSTRGWASTWAQLLQAVSM